MTKIKDGVIHCHTHNSLKDSALLVEELVDKAVELGAPAITLTDHGTMIGTDEFMEICEKKGIKGIPGVEGYYQEDDSYKTRREHIILLPKNNDGLTAIWQIVTDSNKRIQDGFPRINMEILHRYLDEGRIGYNNVICQSACVGGILASVLLANEDIKKEIKKLETSLKSLPNPEDNSYKLNKQKLEDVSRQLNELNERKTNLQKIAKRPFKKKEKAVEKALVMKDDELYRELSFALEKEKEETQNAILELENLSKEIAKTSKTKTLLNSLIKEAESKHMKWHECNNAISLLNSKISSEKDLYDKTKEKAIEFRELFGKENFYIELQYHGIEAEAYAMPILAKLAKELNIPVVACNDVHTADNSEKSLKARQLIRSLRFNQYEEINKGDDQLYVKTDEELSNALLNILPKDIVDEAMKNIGVVVNSCNIVKNKDSHYPKFISEIASETANAAIERYCRERISLRYPNKNDWTIDHEKRLKHELNIITSMGYSDYHLIVQDFLNFGRKLGKLSDKDLSYVWENISRWDLKEYIKYVEEHATNPALSIGPGRGSAAGSIVCYLLGITSIDPIKYGLLFERFLNPERVSMPDIDSDFSPRVRDLVIEYVKKKYGNDSVCCIATKQLYKARNSVRSAARILSHKNTGTTKSYLALADEIAKSIPNEVKMCFDKCIDDLHEKYADNELALEIIDTATLIENRLSSFGMHAAGVIISDGNDVSNYVPLMWDNKKKRWKTQCDMVQSEARGLLKMDFLGLKNLDIITDALRFIKERTGEDIDIEKIPFEEKVFSKIYSAGLTNSVFQFESSGMKNMIKQFQPNSIDDIILLVAAYRPGPMQYLDKIIKVKHGKEKISYITPELEPILKPTYGAIIYQEQVQQVFRDLAGYSLGQADLVRRAMSKKKEAVIQAERTAFVYGDSKRGIVGCQKNGIDPDKANKLFDEILDFAQYAFNKSHAAAYAIVSYMTAWLKCNYTIEYMCAVMSRTELTKMAGLISDCKIMGIDVLQPDINESEIGFSIKNSAIVFGLSCIKNVGNSAEPIIAERMKNGRFVSLKDFVKRYNVKKDVLESLIYSGALDSFGKNRYAMAYIIEDIKKLTKIISDKENVLETAKVELDGIFNEIKDQGLIDSTFLDERCSLAEQDIIDIVEKTKETKKRECKAKGTALKSKATQIRKAKEAINDAKFEFSRIVVPNLSENKKERLAKEKEMLGIYVSEHPLDSYPSAASLETTEIIDLEANKFSSVIGIISNLRKTVTKKGNKPLAFFTLEDKTGAIDVNCFTAAYDEFGEFIEEDAVVIIEGKCTEEEAFNSKSEDSDDDDEIETVKKLTVKNIKPVKAKERTLSLHVPSIEFWNDNLVENIKRYLADDGYRLIIYDELFNEYRYTDLFVSGDILNNNLSLKAIILE